MYKLCNMFGYVWNVSVYCGRGSSNRRTGLDHSGSVVIDLGKKLLD